MIAEQQIEDHPFPAFVPDNATILIIGSFPGREQTQSGLSDNEWFYGAKRNQFWKIISVVYNIPLSTKNDKQKLFERYGIGITDVFLKVKRKKPSNLDQYIDVNESTYNDKTIKLILSDSKINSVLFTSKFVEKHFRKLFPEINYYECLPSPSPRFARMTKAEKIESYRSKLPQ